MALVLKMQINEQPENQYVFSTGDGGQIELIPLSVVANGSYSAPDGKAYNLVTVNVPETELDTLNITENGTYNAPDGTAYNVVTVDVQPILDVLNVAIPQNGVFDFYPENDGYKEVHITVDVPTETPTLVPLSDIVNQNGPYTATPPEGTDGFSDVNLTIDVPTGGGGDVVTVYKTFSPIAQGAVHTIDLSEDAPQDKELIGFIIRPASGTWQSIANGGGRGVIVYYTATRDIESNTMWFKTWLHKSSTSSSMAVIGNGGVRSSMSVTPQASPLADVVGYDNINEAIKIYCRAVDTTTTSAYGFASYCPYELFAFYK